MLKTIAKDAGLTPAQQLLNDVWDERVRDEFATTEKAWVAAIRVRTATAGHRTSRWLFAEERGEGF
jgi:hypothetical protein